MKKIILTFLFSFLMLACAKKEELNQINRFIVDKNSISAEAKDRLSDKVSLKLIPIETNDSSVMDLSISKIEFDGDTIVIYDLKSDQFLIFNKEGKFINSFNRKGEGPEEYIYGDKFTAKNGKIHLIDRNSIKKYDYKGNFLGKINAESSSRGELAITDDNDIYLRQNYVYPYQLIGINGDGSIAWEALPPNKKMMNFSAPAGPEDNAIGNLGEKIFIGVPMDQNIYEVKDTTISVLANFNFKSDNIPDDFFDQDEETIYKKFYERRGNSLERGGFVYFDHVFINDNWIILNPVGSQTTRLLLADRRTGDTYGFEVFPDQLQQLMGKQKYINAYDKNTDSFVIGVTADHVKAVLEELRQDGKLDAFPELIIIDTDNINEDDNGFLLMINFQ